MRRGTSRSADGTVPFGGLVVLEENTLRAQTIEIRLADARLEAVERELAAHGHED